MCAIQRNYMGETRAPEIVKQICLRAQITDICVCLCLPHYSGFMRSFAQTK